MQKRLTKRFNFKTYKMQFPVQFKVRRTAVS